MTILPSFPREDAAAQIEVEIFTAVELDRPTSEERTDLLTHFGNCSTVAALLNSVPDDA